PWRLIAKPGFVAVLMVRRSPLQEMPRSVERRTWIVWFAPAVPSAQAMYTTELFRESTAMASCPPTRCVPRRSLKGALEAPVTTRTPAFPSPVSTKAVNGLGPDAQLSSRTTTMSMVLEDRQPRYTP